MSINKHTKGTTGTNALALPGMTLRTIRAPIVSAASGVETSTGAKIPAKSLVLHTLIDLATGASSVTPLLDVGTLSTASGGDADGLLAGINIATAGALKGSMVAGGRTLGALSFVGSAASQLFAEPYVCDIERTVSFTPRALLSAVNGEIVILVASL